MRSKETTAEERITQLASGIREANLLLADLKSTMRDARKLVTEIDALVKSGVEDKIGNQAEETIAKLGEATSDAIKRSEQAIYDRFDELEKVLMGEDKQSVKEGRESIPELVNNLPFCIVHRKRHAPATVTPMCVFRE